jgi:dihydrofolate reductase
MGKISAEISISLDGYIAGPNDSVDNGLGDGGERLHEWVVRLKSWREAHGYEGGESGPDDERFAESVAKVGAAVIGRRMFDHAEGPWGEEPPFHHPVFVLTHRPREPLVKEGGTTFTFVTDGIESALAGAREAAGEKDVAIGGGGQAIQQFLAAGLLDELQLHLIPIFLGGGVSLFDRLGPRDPELECTEAIASPGVTHLKYRIVK